MPQFDPSYFISQIFWLFIFGGILYWGIKKYALPNVAKALALRGEKTEGRLREAELMKLESERLKIAMQNELLQAKDQANDMINMAHQERAVSNAHHRNEFLALLKERIGATEKSIEIKKKKALEDISSIALETSLHITEKLTRKTIPQSEALKFFDKALKDYNNTDDDIKKVNHV